VWWTRFSGHGLDEPGNDAVAATAPVVAKPADYDVDIRVLPVTASIAIDGEVIAAGRYRSSFAGDGAVHTVTLTAPDHATVQRRFQGATTLEVSLEPLTPASEPSAAADSTAPDDSDAAKQERSRSGHDARNSHRDRGHTSANVPSRQDGAAAKAPTGPTMNAGGSGTGSGSAAVPARPKASDDSFAPSSDNIDPFKTGN
jgi:hypothetical protein